jgi:hypothetical protein
MSDIPSIATFAETAVVYGKGNRCVTEVASSFFISSIMPLPLSTSFPLANGAKRN